MQTCANLTLKESSRRKPHYWHTVNI